MNLFDLFTKDQLQESIDAGHVRIKGLASDPLAILNYTEAAQFERAWTPVTLACRGLIFHTETFEIVAMPFGKFFNHGEPSAPVIDASRPVVVTDKLDGSLGIGYRLPISGEYAIATRGSFQSEQALHATDLWNTKYAGEVTVPDHITPLFEIIYPENRIVCDYFGLDDLVLIGAVDMTTGRSMDARRASWALLWTGPTVQEFPYTTLAKALAAEPRAGAEGLVVFDPDADVRVKIKQEDYIALHRIVTGLNERTVWEHAAAGKPLADLVESLPDEFHRWVIDVWDALHHQFHCLTASVRMHYVSALRQAYGCTPDGKQIMPERPISREDRKTFAHWATREQFTSMLFLLLDERSIDAKVWELVRPEAGRTPSGRTFTEDTT